jgi:integrase
VPGAVAQRGQAPARAKVGKGLRVTDVKRILAEAQKTRLYALYVVAATLGLRRGELLGLRWEDLDLDKGTLTVAQTVQRVSGRLLVDEAKSEASEATEPLPRITRRVLLEHRDRQEKERVDAGEFVVGARLGVHDERRHTDRAPEPESTLRRAPNPSRSAEGSAS